MNRAASDQRHIVVPFSRLVHIGGAGVNLKPIGNDPYTADGAVVVDHRDDGGAARQDHRLRCGAGDHQAGAAAVPVEVAPFEPALPVQRGLESRQRLVDLSLKVISQTIDLCVYSFLKCQCTLSCKGFRTS